MLAKRLGLALAMIFSLAPLCHAAGAGRKPATRPALPDAESTRTLRFGPVSSDVIESIWTTVKADLPAQVKRITGSEKSLESCHFVIEPVSKDEVKARLMIEIEGPDPQPKAREVADWVVDQVKRRFENPLAESITYLSELRDKVENEAQSERHDQQAIQARLRELTGRADVSEAGLRSAMDKLDQESQSLSIDLAALAARKDALRQSIAEQSKVAEERTKVDPILDELKKVADLRQSQYDTVKSLVNAGRATPADLSAATAALAEVRVKILERQELLATRAGGDVLSGWNKELLNLSIDAAEKEARLVAIKKRLSAISGADDLLARLDDARRRLGAATERAAVIEKRLTTLKESQLTAPKRWFVIDESKDEMLP